MANKVSRPIDKVVQGMKLMEGAGVRICRTVGTPALRNLDPYLMLDELRLPAEQASAGFPDHPHRGFETCSIMFKGEMRHEDSVGNKGVIKDGGVQWMTAGRGIVHSEMPTVTAGDLWGFQLWINLPAKDKMIKPRYQDYQPESIPVVEEEGTRVRVMAGEYKGTKGPIEMRNPGLLMDVTLRDGASFEKEIPEPWNGFAYICDGTGTIGDEKASRETAMVFGKGNIITAQVAADGYVRFLLICGQPIGEPVVQHGPFVMNSQDEIKQAFADYMSGKLQNPDDKVWESWQAEA